MNYYIRNKLPKMGMNKNSSWYKRVKKQKLEVVKVKIQVCTNLKAQFEERRRKKGNSFTYLDHHKQQRLQKEEERVDDPLPLFCSSVLKNYTKTPTDSRISKKPQKANEERGRDTFEQDSGWKGRDFRGNILIWSCRKVICQRSNG